MPDTRSAQPAVADPVTGEPIPCAPYGACSRQAKISKPAWASLGPVEASVCSAVSVIPIPVWLRLGRWCSSIRIDPHLTELTARVQRALMIGGVRLLRRCDPLCGDFRRRAAAPRRDALGKVLVLDRVGLQADDFGGPLEFLESTAPIVRVSRTVADATNPAGHAQGRSILGRSDPDAINGDRRHAHNECKYPSKCSHTFFLNLK